MIIHLLIQSNFVRNVLPVGFEDGELIDDFFAGKLAGPQEMIIDSNSLLLLFSVNGSMPHDIPILA